MIPESRLKKPEHIQFSSLIATRDQLVKLKVSLLNKVYSLFVKHGIKIKTETFTSKKGFEFSVHAHKWEALEQIELEVIASQQ